jgi:hypothetical protein
MPVVWCLASSKTSGRGAVAELPARAAGTGALWPGLVFAGGRVFAGQALRTWSAPGRDEPDPSEPPQ